MVGTHVLSRGLGDVKEAHRLAALIERLINESRLAELRYELLLRVFVISISRRKEGTFRVGLLKR